MSKRFKITLMGLMVSALFFGFLHLFISNKTLYDYERLHIFLFNLCSGGTVLLLYTEGKNRLDVKTSIFLILSFTYAILAFMKQYMPAMIVAVILGIIVDVVRVQRFSYIPKNFFQPDAPVDEKFHQAALLCLSCGLIISALVILNNEYLKIFDYPKLKLNTFFLGFSFPISLITMSVIFSSMTNGFSRFILRLQNVGFWNVNLGVIIFFIFILFERLIPQLVVTTILFLSVILIYFMFKDLAKKAQEKHFLTSGIFFLLYTSITGIAYIILEFTPTYDSPEQMKILLRMHSFSALYGWNLTGLAVICRKGDFPIRMHSNSLIAIHWLTAVFLAPMGTYFRSFAVIALVCYGLIIYIMLFTKGSKQSAGLPV